MSLHISRGWPGQQHMEAECPCPTEACGYVDTSKVVDACEQHPVARAKTIRSSHDSRACPARNGERSVS
ncbi:hypothetical protein [Agromyces sp. NPDC058104]|uniref:hypothetical protein n=1 Tax=Agromyces sp. NPDC058104 TaxID=3346342 RepID=UPI0036DE0034